MSAKGPVLGVMAGVFLIMATAVTSPAVIAQEYVPKVVAQDPDKVWSVEDLGEGVYLFRWWPGFYVSPFVVGDGAVLAVDPISRDVASLYRTAIAAVTAAPITKIVYSHDHRDHIVGADVLSPTATIYAHPGTLASIARRGDKDIPKPTQLVDDGDTIAIAGRTVGVHYFGPNHGYSNIALSYKTGKGTLLQFVDTLEIGIVPYRTLPDTNVQGYIASLAGASKLDVQWVLGGHSGPGPALWITNYLDYFRDMSAALIKAEAEVVELPSETVDDVIARGEIHTDAVIKRAIDTLRPRYGQWRGFEAWAPLNAQAVRMYLITGN